MSEIITTKNLNCVIKINKKINSEISEMVTDLFTRYNIEDGIKAEEKLAMKILKDKGLIQLPIKDKYWGGGIFFKGDKKIPVLNTAQPRVYQYFVAWHEVYHLLYDKVSISHKHNILIDMNLNERKADYFASKIMLGNVHNYFNSLSEDNFIDKIIHCMDIYKSPYKAILINLYEQAIKSNNINLENLILENFDKKINFEEKFKQLGLDDELVKPSSVISIGYLEKKIQNAMIDNPEASYNKTNLDFLKILKRNIEDLINE